MKILIKSVLIGLVSVFWSCADQNTEPTLTEPLPVIIIENEVEEVMEENRIISTDSNFTLALVKTVAVLPGGYDYLYKDSIVLSCVELQRIDSSQMLIAEFITESWSRPEYYLTASIKSKEVFASSSYGLFVFEPNKIKFYFCSDAFDHYKDSTSIVIAYDAPYLHDMNGNPQIFIEFKLDDFQNQIQYRNRNSKYSVADKKWFLRKGIPHGVFRGKDEVYTIGN